jgi:hypothetical protein
MKVSGAIRSFNGGYFSPLLQGRTDIEKYGSSCADLVGFIPTIQGPAIACAGTIFLTEVKQSTVRTWFGKFKFNATQNYILEIGHRYIRFHTDHGVLLDGASPLEVETPYDAADLITTEDTFALSMYQSADVIYIAHPDFQVRTLTRYGATDWRLELLELTGGPFKARNETSTTVYASAQTGAVTITASAAIFSEDHIGSTFYIEQSKATAVTQWETNTAVNLNSYRRSVGKNYKALNSDTTGDEKPIHIEGTESDGVVNWEYSDRGFGVVKITGFTSSTVVTGTVTETLPVNAVLSTNATDKWAFAKYSDVEGWPSIVTFFRERLVFAKDTLLDFSVAASYEDFNKKDASNQVVADMAISLQLSTSDPIRFVVPVNTGLMVGTAGEIWVVSEITTSDPFGPGNTKAELQDPHGCNQVEPVRVKNIAVFPSASGKQVLEMGYDISQDSYLSGDLTAFATDIVSGRVSRFAYGREPYSIIWSVTKDGQLAGLVHSMEHKVKAWFTRPIGGTGIVEDVIVIPSPDNDYDEVYILTKRTINGDVKRYIEYMVPEWDSATDDIEDAFYVDCGLSYTGVASAVITGADHLEAQTVSILAGGAVHRDLVVTNGSITLDAAATPVHVGLAYDAHIESMRIEGGSQNGGSFGKAKRINKVALQFMDTAGGKYGYDADHLFPIVQTSARNQNTTATVFDGFKVLDFTSPYTDDPHIYIQRDQPLPMTVLGIYPDFESYAR